MDTRNSSKRRFTCQRVPGFCADCFPWGQPRTFLNERAVRGCVVAGFLRAVMKTRCEILAGLPIVRSSAVLVLPGSEWRFNRQRPAFGCGDDDSGAAAGGRWAWQFGPMPGFSAPRIVRSGIVAGASC